MKGSGSLLVAPELLSISKQQQQQQQVLYSIKHFFMLCYCGFNPSVPCSHWSSVSTVNLKITWGIISVRTLSTVQHYFWRKGSCTLIRGWQWGRRGKLFWHNLSSMGSTFFSLLKDDHLIDKFLWVLSSLIQKAGL